jgi:hypothetical protein
MLPPRHDSDVSALVCGTEFRFGRSPVLGIHTNGVAPTLACCSGMSSHRGPESRGAVLARPVWLHPWPELTIRSP